MSAMAADASEKRAGVAGLGKPNCGSELTY
jgi:hypothetical protein